ncbi:MAG TPA: hypothetical protein VN277_04980 [Acidiferrobacterales bacterium]|nr:hypothetical protein [Acidiferrobacterales bacterium]
MDDLLAVVVAILNWRVVLSASAAFALAVYMVRTLSWFSGPMGIALFLAGLVGGLVWQEHARGVPLVSAVEQQPISKPVAVLVFAFFGGVWSMLGSAAPANAAVLLAGVSLLVGAWYAVVLKRKVPFGFAVVCVASLAVGFALPVAIRVANG